MCALHAALSLGVQSFFLAFAILSLPRKKARALPKVGENQDGGDHDEEEPSRSLVMALASPPRP